MMPIQNLLVCVGRRRQRGRLAALCVVAAAASASARPVVDLSFSPADAAPPAVLKLGAGAKVGAERAPSGSAALVFDGTEAAASAFDAAGLAERLAGGDATVSLWFRIDDFHDGAIGLGCAVQKAPGWGLSHLVVNLETEPTVFGKQSVGTGIDRDIVTGRWHHVAYAYSASNRLFRAFFDGRLQSDYRVGHTETTPLKDLLAPLGRKFRGQLADVRIWNRVLDEEAMLAFTPSAEAVAEAGRRLAALRDGAGHAGFRAWCEAWIAAASAQRQSTASTTTRWQALQDALDLAPRLAAWAKEVAPGSALASAPLLCLEIHPYSHEKRLPFAAPSDGKIVDSLRLRAAKGEHEAASFMLLPLRDVKAFELKVSALESDAATIPADCLDLRVVKVWYAPSLSWDTYFAGGREFPKLLPELLLRDDALVQVDERARRNRLRIDYPSGSRYVDVSAPGGTAEIPPFNYVMEPVADSPSLRPLPLASGRFQQFWLTARVPVDAAPGAYRGTVAMVADGKEVGRLALALEVLPFALPRARTRHDLSREYIGGMMHHCGLGSHIAMGKSRADAERRLLAEFRNLAEHNILHPFGPSFDNPEHDDLAIRQLEIMREAGLPCTLIFGGSAADMGWYGSEASPESDPTGFLEALERFQKRIDRQMALWDVQVGHRNVFFSGVDEAGPWGVRRQMPFFAELKRRGGRVFVTSGVFKDAGFAVDANDDPANINPATAAQWHATGGRLLSYAAPFTGPENPDLWRRTKGMRLYQAGYDGLAEYILYEGHHIWNEFVAAGRYKNFNLVYPTRDGLVDTVAWEALREGFDDVRYATLLRLLAAEALKSGPRELQDTARKAVAWLACVDPETVDLDAMRGQMVDWILQMHRALPHWRPPAEPVATSSAKPLPSPPGPSDAEALDAARKWIARNEYDHAIVALRQAAGWSGASPEARIEALTKLGECLRARRDRPGALEAFLTITTLREADRRQRGLAHLACAATWLAPVERDVQPAPETLKEAMAALTRAEETQALPPGDLAEAWLGFARAQRGAGLLAEAAETCRRVAAMNRLPEKLKGQAHLLLGDCLVDLGDPRMAVLSYEQAIPSAAYSALSKIGATARAAGDYRRAQAAYADLLPLAGEEEKKWVKRQLKLLTQVAKPVVKIQPENLELRKTVDDDELDRLLLGP